MEEAAGVRYERPQRCRARSETRLTRPWSVYADDMVALCHSRQQAEQVKARLAAWLAPGGLSFNEDKTRIVTLEDGFDFLGFNVRRYRGKLMTKPSKAAVKRVKHRLAAEMRALRGATRAAVLARRQPDRAGFSGGRQLVA